MKEKVFKNEYKKAEKYKYYSAPFIDRYYPKRVNVMKNYIIEPDIESITLK